MPDDAQNQHRRQVQTPSSKIEFTYSGKRDPAGGWAFELVDGSPPAGRIAVGTVLYKRSGKERLPGLPWATELKDIEAAIRVSEAKPVILDDMGHVHHGSVRFSYLKPVYNDALEQLELKLQLRCQATQAEFEYILQTGADEMKLFEVQEFSTHF